MVLPEKGLYNGRTYFLLGLSDENVLDSKYKYFSYKNSTRKNPYKNEKIDTEPRYYKYEYKYDNNNLRLFLFGDSFDLNLMKFASTSFADTKAIYTWVASNKDMKRFDLRQYKNEILENKPDVIIICFSNIIRLKYLFG